MGNFEHTTLSFVDTGTLLWDSWIFGDRTGLKLLNKKQLSFRTLFFFIVHSSVFVRRNKRNTSRKIHFFFNDFCFILPASVGQILQLY